MEINKKNLYRWKGLLLMLGLLAGACALHAQTIEKVYQSEVSLDSTLEKKLFVTIDNLNFFRNNEWVTAIAPGYTLPGFWFQPKLVCYPIAHIKLEAGLHSLWYWGTSRYPSYAYSRLPYWDGEQSSCPVHVLPYLRAQASFSDRVHLIFGDIYGGANHRLAEPLYNPELNLTADPEAGVQLLYNLPWMDLDTWVNWTTFIYPSDTRQESFIYGLSVRWKINRPESPWHVYALVQALAQHQGGQIDAVDRPIHTVLNGLAGIGIDRNFRAGALKRLNLEWDMTGYDQQAGERWPLKSGYGNYVSLTADVAAFRLKSAYWSCDRFISILGNPFFSAAALSSEDSYFERPAMITFGAAYTRSFAPGFAMGIDFDIYRRFAATLHDPVAGNTRIAAKCNYSFGIYFRMTPSFLLISR